MSSIFQNWAKHTSFASVLSSIALIVSILSAYYTYQGSYYTYQGQRFAKDVYAAEKREALIQEFVRLQIEARRLQRRVDALITYSNFKVPTEAAIEFGELRTNIALLNRNLGTGIGKFKRTFPSQKDNPAYWQRQLRIMGQANQKMGSVKTALGDIRKLIKEHDKQSKPR